MRLVGNDPERGASEMYVALLAAIGRARARVWLTYGYFVPDPESVRALKDAAARGVDVRLVLPGVSDFWAPLYAGRSLRRSARRRVRTSSAAIWYTPRSWSSMASVERADQPRLADAQLEADVIVLGPAFARSMEELLS
jgi:cardiolipin synthase